MREAAEKKGEKTGRELSNKKAPFTANANSRLNRTPRIRDFLPSLLLMLLSFACSNLPVSPPPPPPPLLYS